MIPVSDASRDSVAGRLSEAIAERLLFDRDLRSRFDASSRLLAATHVPASAEVVTVGVLLARVSDVGEWLTESAAATAPHDVSRSALQLPGLLITVSELAPRKYHYFVYRRAPGLERFRDWSSAALMALNKVASPIAAALRPFGAPQQVEWLTSPNDLIDDYTGAPDAAGYVGGFVSKALGQPCKIVRLPSDECLGLSPGLSTARVLATVERATVKAGEVIRLLNGEAESSPSDLTRYAPAAERWFDNPFVQLRWLCVATRAD